MAAFVAVTCLLCLARAADPAQKAIKPGDKLRVTSGPAPVKVGKKTLTTVEAGTELKALKAQGNWVRVTVERDGKKITGWIHRKRLSVVAAKTKRPSARPLATRIALATEAELREADRRVEAKARSLVQRLKSRVADTRYFAQKELIRLRPLPASVVGPLIQCLSGTEKKARQAAASLLAYHQRSPGTALPALRTTRAAEKDKDIRRQLDAAIAILEAAGKESPVLAHSAHVGQLLETAIREAARTPGRLFRVSRLVSYVDMRVWRTVSPTTEHVPERVVLRSKGADCEAVIGWEWQMQFEDGKSRLDPPPIGAILCLEDALALTKSQLAKGTILSHTTQGWSVITEQEAIKRLRVLLSLKQRLDFPFPDHRVVAALGAAALGPRAKTLSSELIAVAKSNIKDVLAGMLVSDCAVALGRIAETTALPALRQLRKDAGDHEGIVSAIDAAIAQLER